MSKFYFFLWLRWSLRVAICSILMACGVSFLITLSLYIFQGMPSFTEEILKALFQVFKFWFPITFSLTLLLALFRSLKYIFNICINGYKMQLLECENKEIVDELGYGDLVKIWRKWFMLIVWLVGAQMILSLIFTYLFTSCSGVFEWFDIYFLFTFVLIAGYISFILLSGRCKQVRVVKC
ncbi:MAG: hypothetical protein J7J96_07945 [Sulfurimonas sp.]|nr:hypothetical protein [Sulfurimonas sp.]